jgi:hypothetical protein
MSAAAINRRAGRCLDSVWVKTALLLWDRLEFIVPWDHFRANHGHPQLDRAMELIGLPHIPTKEEKRETHQNIKQMLKRSLPAPFYLRRHRRHYRDQQYEIYPEKLFPETWELLYEARLSGKLLPNVDYPMTEMGGLLVMSLLADACAGTTRSRITDRSDAFATVVDLLGNRPNAPPIKRADADAQLVPINLKVLNVDKIDIKALIHLRERSYPLRYPLEVGVS